ncbi:hypothetical protein SPRG_03918 [Saprolegnia parasitica CBS 223.65]|uniref:Uncharacterized protein n=1 Tax=Saprolegnia parasitica (strain CBS 223.65) TaxID=695850 RepID=A0A067CWX6_SAPPC|nr:hypothetical protein SPRG_03918 [Saprolegnia parasitica CBS 223.65]KDO31302.1 hypothetical protein SPRG_03918 [Saprolegnia parasitica CBS 223.65]|eukprot:XP_012197901.1 hypothetical protein SPRG_03918 [Saprolegnia parasitica CBS 223.65]
MEKSPMLHTATPERASGIRHAGHVVAAAAVLGLVVLVQQKTSSPPTELSLRPTNLNADYWMQVATPDDVAFRQVSAADGRVCGTTTANHVLCADESNLAHWTPLVGSTQHIELANGMLFRTATDDSLSFAHATEPSAWSAMLGKNVQLSSNGGYVCGVDRSSSAYCLNMASPIAWAVMWPGHADVGAPKQFVLHGDDAFFAVTDRDELFAGKPSVGALLDVPQVAQVPGLFTQLSSNGHALCGVTRQTEIFCATENLSSSPNWRVVAHVPGNAASVHIADTRMYAVNARGQLFAHAL